LVMLPKPWMAQSRMQNQATTLGSGFLTSAVS
jgi:hypothetical protein